MSAGTVATGRTSSLRAPTFGRYLQTVRLERGLRLEAVADETRIAPSTLKAIEAEDFDRLPPDVFLKGFLRAFARAVGADEREALALYLEHCRFQEAGRPAAASPSAARSAGAWKLGALLAAFAGLIVLSLLAYRYWSLERTAEAPPQPPAAAVPAAAPVRPPSEATKRPHMPAGPVYVLVISAQDESWVKVSIDQGTPSEYHLKAGGQLRLEAATGFNLLVGNAAGLKMTLDNRPVPVPGRRGEVVNLQLP
jgi:transcriptional regulator with XRE-family HTH domain